MQEKIQSEQSQVNSFFLPEILSIQDQKKILRCPNHNQANSVCISQECLMPGLMCLQSTCQCRKIHYKCHHILLDRVLQSIEKHQKQIPIKVKQTYKAIYQVINQMIQKLSKLRTKFQREEQYFGLRQEELQLMDLINQSKIDQVNGKIISSLEKFFDADIQMNKNSKEAIIKDFEFKSQEFDKMCKYIEENYLQTRFNQKVFKQNEKLFMDSKIIKEDQDRQLLNKWLCEEINNPQKQLKSELLFRASENNFEALKFHKACDGKKNTLVIVRNQFEKTIGGFASKEWCNQNKYMNDGTKRTFIYSLNLKEKYKCIHFQKSIYGSLSHGPNFTDGGNLRILDKCNQNKLSSGIIGDSYKLEHNPKKYNPLSQQTRTLFTGNPNGYDFKVLQYQVYQIIGM